MDHNLEISDAMALHDASELTLLNDYMHDDTLEEMINLAIKCLANPNMKPETAERLLVQFQSANFKFGLMAATFMTIKKGKTGTEENNKKNIYYTAADLCDKMAASLKYIVRRNA